MNGLSFHRRATINDPPTFRSDITCFVGLINARVGKPLPPEVADWLVSHSWIQNSDSGKSLGAAGDTKSLNILNIPVPIESWAVFDSVFQWESRTPDGSAGPTYVGMAVRAFFDQGGHKCYVVAVPGCDTPEAVAANQDRLLAACVPASVVLFPAHMPSEQDPESWKGVWALFGLVDVSFLLLPDLPELVRAAAPPLPSAIQPPAVEEHFAVCDESAARPAVADSPLSADSAPRCDHAAFSKWQKILNTVQQYFQGTRAGQTLQLIAALPLPLDRAAFGSTLEDIVSILPGDRDSRASFAAGFFQVCYPWLRVDAAELLPEHWLPPDGVLAGILARNALTRGTFKDATKVEPYQIYDLYPLLSKEDYTVREAPVSPGSGVVAPPLTLVQRLSLFGSTPQGYRLMSDVTTSQDANYRFGPVKRLVSALVQAAREVGEASMFDSSGPRLWGRIKHSLEALLTRFWNAGALDGATAADAFSVRCDRSTMLQADIDAGRVIAEVVLRTALSIEEIRVTLVVSSGVLSIETPAAVLVSAEVA